MTFLTVWLWLLGVALVVAALISIGLAMQRALSFERGAKTPKSPRLRRGAYWR